MYHKRSEKTDSKSSGGKKSFKSRFKENNSSAGSRGKRR